MLLVDKPAGLTSHDVVARARRALRTDRIGHAGTLDPFATGLLILLVGRATRLLPYLDAEPKTYEAVIRFGAETTTDDCTGEVVRQAPPPDSAAVDHAIAALSGAIDQVPPAFSAKKVAGRRAYAVARRGETVPLAPVRVVVHSWTVRGRSADELQATITCGGGTYIRALARDLGRHAGSAAHLAALRRVRSGAFSVTDALALDALDRAPAALLPMRTAVAALPAQAVSDGELQRIGHGNSVDARIPGERVALLDAAGNLVAIAERSGDTLRPRVVLREA